MRVAVIGGGPAGMIAAIKASEQGNTVILFEKNEKLGKKLYITGKGRCNLTNNTDNENFIKNISSNPKFLISAINAFSPRNAMDFFENLGVKLKTERGDRVFPASDKSSDIIDALEKRLVALNVELHLKESVKHFIQKDTKIVAIATENGKYDCDTVILATGGKSYPLTGSNGEGYSFSKSLGHSVIEPKPGLCAIELKGAVTANNKFIPLKELSFLEGLSLKNVTAKIIDISKNKLLFEEFGEMLFTDKGFSGPIILTLSSKIAKMDLKNLRLSLDLKPALDIEKLDERILRDFAKFSNKQLKNALNELLPSGLIPLIIELSELNPNSFVNVVSKKERQCLKKSLKNLTFEINSLYPFNNAIITVGGVSTKEIDPKTMKSKIIDNLYFAGEIIDVDAFTGGFNLQIAFSTGYVAGINQKS